MHLRYLKVAFNHQYFIQSGKYAVTLSQYTSNSEINQIKYVQVTKRVLQKEKASVQVFSGINLEKHI